jgi:hypothetical protein
MRGGPAAADAEVQNTPPADLVRHAGKNRFLGREKARARTRVAAHHRRVAVGVLVGGVLTGGACGIRSGHGCGLIGGGVWATK